MAELPNIVKAVYDQAAKRIEVYPCHANRASMLGGDCERQLVYWRTKWDEAVPHDVNLQLIFDEGNTHEAAVLKSLAEAGIRINEQQTSLAWKEHQITGHVDGTLIFEDRAYPVEIKSMSSHIWDSIAFRGPGVYEWDEVKAKFQSKPWLRKYQAQLSLYMLLKNIDRAVMICKNKGTGALMQINMGLDYEYAESMLQRADRINEHVAKGTLPERIPWDENVCAECPFVAICCPENVGSNPLAYVQDETAAKRLAERAAAEEASGMFKDAHEWLVEWVWAKYPDAPLVQVGSEWTIKKSKSATGRRTTKITRGAAPVE